MPLRWVHLAWFCSSRRNHCKTARPDKRGHSAAKISEHSLRHSRTAAIIQIDGQCWLRKRDQSGRTIASSLQSIADHFPPRAHNQSMNTNISCGAFPVPQSLSPLVPWSLGPLVPVLPPPPPLWKSPGILRSLSRNTPGINQFTFLSVNYPVNFNPEKRPLFSPKGPALGAKRPPFRSFCAHRLQPLDKCRPLAHPYRALSKSCMTE